MVPFVTVGTARPHDTPRDVVGLQVFGRTGKQPVEAIEFIAEGDGAVIYHHYTGKERTGVLAAVILGLLGVSEADVLADYLLSAPAEGEMRSHAAAEGMFFFPSHRRQNHPSSWKCPRLTGWWESLNP